MVDMHREAPEMRERTWMLRRSLEYEYPRLRALMSAKGVDAERCVLVDYFQDDVALSYGLLITPDARVIEFDYCWVLSREPRACENEGVFSQWEDITSNWRDSAHSTTIRVGLGLLGSF